MYMCVYVFVYVHMCMCRFDINDIFMANVVLLL